MGSNSAFIEIILIINIRLIAYFVAPLLDRAMSMKSGIKLR